jgi:hypothetical protein
MKDVGIKGGNLGRMRWRGLSEMTRCSDLRLYRRFRCFCFKYPCFAKFIPYYSAYGNPPKMLQMQRFLIFLARSNRTRIEIFVNFPVRFPVSKESGQSRARAPLRRQPDPGVAASLYRPCRRRRPPLASSRIWFNRSGKGKSAAARVLSRRPCAPLSFEGNDEHKRLRYKCRHMTT